MVIGILLFFASAALTWQTLQGAAGFILQYLYDVNIIALGIEVIWDLLLFIDTYFELTAFGTSILMLGIWHKEYSRDNCLPVRRSLYDLQLIQITIYSALTPEEESLLAQDPSGVALTGRDVGYIEMDKSVFVQVGTAEAAGVLSRRANRSSAASLQSGSCMPVAQVGGWNQNQPPGVIGYPQGVVQMQPQFQPQPQPQQYIQQPPQYQQQSFQQQEFQRQQQEAYEREQYQIQMQQQQMQQQQMQQQQMHQQQMQQQQMQQQQMQQQQMQQQQMQQQQMYQQQISVAQGLEMGLVVGAAMGAIAALGVPEFSYDEINQDNAVDPLEYLEELGDIEDL
jgi:hypothetical protein